MHHINEFGFVVFTYPLANSALETVTDFRKALNDEPLMQAIYRALHPLPSAFFEGKQLWDKIIEASKLAEFIEFYMMIKHKRTLSPLWKHDESWHCFNGILHSWTAEDDQWLCQLAALQEGERVDSDLILYTYIKYSIWAGKPKGHIDY
jgi:hypothetical protein